MLLFLFASLCLCSFVLAAAAAATQNKPTKLPRVKTFINGSSKKMIEIQNANTKRNPNSVEVDGKLQQKRNNRITPN